MFIDQKIWGVASARKVLQDKLMSNWRDEHFAEVGRINLGHRSSEFDWYPQRAQREWRMLGNVVVTADDSENIHILSKDSETM